MKKRILVFVSLVAFATVLLNAQVSEYENHMNEARNHENNGSIIYAMGTYYDAFSVNVENGKKAYDCFETYYDAVSSGKPGLKDSYDEFEMYDGWLSLLQEAEKYWTEHAAEIYNLKYSLSRVSIDPSKRTANYNGRVWTAGTREKFDLMIGALQKGLKASYQKEWGKIPEDWPYHSVFDRSPSYEETGAAVFNQQKYSETYEMFYTQLEKEQYSWTSPSWIASAPVYRDYDSEYRNQHVLFSDCFTVMDAVFSVCDSSGNEYVDLSGNALVESSRTLIQNRYKIESDGNWIRERELMNIEFVDVPQDIMRVIEENLYTVKMKKLYIADGSCSYEMIESVNYSEGICNYYCTYNGPRDFLNSVYLIEVDVNYQNNPDGKIREYESRVKEEKKRAEQEIKYKNNLTNSIESQDYAMFDKVLSQAKSNGFALSYEDVGLTERGYNILCLRKKISSLYASQNLPEAESAHLQALASGYTNEELSLDKTSMASVYSSKMEELFKKGKVNEMKSVYEGLLIKGLLRSDLSIRQIVMNKIISMVKKDIEQSCLKSEYDDARKVYDYALAFGVLPSELKIGNKKLEKMGVK